MNHLPTPPAFRLFEGLLETFSPEGRASALKRRRSGNPGGATLRPGRDTPLWNRLITDLRPFLKRRGEKAQLARLLGVHRQAVNEYFASRSRMPDAERTLLLLEWVAARRQNRRLS